ncbi:tripartite tricarboxylate transporter TctB family protein [Pseudochelatococcus lubricantis]|uniref:tripartite tricarboxylate transporter TctB family protein n=1 Tax=Pseudochelatococcus lubricantis TaxID=1538102 RepID=UPI0035EF77E3
MRIRNKQDFYSGVMFLVLGSGYTLAARNYNFGTSSSMGPGYFPTVLGAILAGIGLLIMFRVLTRDRDVDNPISQIAWRPLLTVIGSAVLFGVLLAGVPSLGIPSMGLIVAIIGMVLLVSTADHEFTFRGALVLALCLAALSYLLFVKGLSLYFRILPEFISFY